MFQFTKKTNKSKEAKVQGRDIRQPFCKIAEKEANETDDRVDMTAVEKLTTEPVVLD